MKLENTTKSSKKELKNSNEYEKYCSSLRESENQDLIDLNPKFTIDYKIKCKKSKVLFKDRLKTSSIMEKLQNSKALFNNEAIKKYQIENLINNKSPSKSCNMRKLNKMGYNQNEVIDELKVTPDLLKRICIINDAKIAYSSKNECHKKRLYGNQRKKIIINKMPFFSTLENCSNEFNPKRFRQFPQFKVTHRATQSPSLNLNPSQDLYTYFNKYGSNIKKNTRFPNVLSYATQYRDNSFSNGKTKNRNAYLKLLKENKMIGKYAKRTSLYKQHSYNPSINQRFEFITIK